MGFADGYELEEARETMALAAVAYQGEMLETYDAVKRAIVSALATTYPLGNHFRLVWLGLSPDRGNLLYVARDDRRPDRFAVVARGTDWNFLTDWVDDFDVLHTHPWPTAQPPDPSIAVAQGSWDGLESLLGMTSDVFDETLPGGGKLTLMELLSRLASAARSPEGFDLFVTGHSLGGALATILGLHLVDTVGDWRVGASSVNFKTYTFASPTTGNASYAAYYDSRTTLAGVPWQSFRVFNEQDVIPHAYDDLAGIASDGIPMSFGLTLELSTIALVVNDVLDDYGVSYEAVAVAEPISNDPPTRARPPQCGLRPCPDPATDMAGFASWVCYEHSSLTYLALLGVPPQGLEDHSLDVASIAATTTAKLGAKAALARSA